MPVIGVQSLAVGYAKKVCVSTGKTPSGCTWVMVNLQLQGGRRSLYPPIALQVRHQSGLLSCPERRAVREGNKAREQKVAHIVGPHIGWTDVLRLRDRKAQQAG